MQKGPCFECFRALVGGVRLGFISVQGPRHKNEELNNLHSFESLAIVCSFCQGALQEAQGNRG
jgi:hypothetical protein